MKTALITGATSGIGEACARLFGHHGFRLILTGRRNERLEKLSAELYDAYQTDTFLLSFDISDRFSCLQAMNNIPDHWQNIDLLINNAGLSLGLEPIQEGNLDDWDRMIDTNVKGLLYVSKLVANWMIKAGTGHIINLGSIAGKQVYPNGNVYCTSKFAVDALTQAMRIDLLPYQIKVSAVNPGVVETEFSQVRFKNDIAKAQRVYEGFHPLTATDIAETIWWIASQPKHVNINDVNIMPAAQATAAIIQKN